MGTVGYLKIINGDMYVFTNAELKRAKKRADESFGNTQRKKPVKKRKTTKRK